MLCMADRHQRGNSVLTSVAVLSDRSRIVGHLNDRESPLCRLDHIMRLIVLAVLLFSEHYAVGDEVAEPLAIAWNGQISLGADLDAAGLPKDKPAATPSQPSLRIGISVSWSFSLKWERVERKSHDEDVLQKEISAEESKLVELTNTERKKQNLHALHADPTLMKLAREHVSTMARLDQIAHELDGKTFSQRMNQAKYRALRAGENIAQSQRSPADAISSWMQSPGHKENILEADYTRIGVATAVSKSGKKYWTQVFAKQD